MPVEQWGVGVKWGQVSSSQMVVSASQRESLQEAGGGALAVHKEGLSGDRRSWVQDERFWLCVQAIASFIRNHSSPRARLSPLTEQPTALGKAAATARVATTGRKIQDADLTDSSMSPGPSPGLDQAGASDNTLWTKRCFTNASSRLEVLSFCLTSSDPRK